VSDPIADESFAVAWTADRHRLYSDAGMFFGNDVPAAASAGREGSGASTAMKPNVQIAQTGDSYLGPTA
jgi:hypothetical protein